MLENYTVVIFVLAEIKVLTSTSKVLTHNLDMLYHSSILNHLSLFIHFITAFKSCSTNSCCGRTNVNTYINILLTVYAYNRCKQHRYFTYSMVYGV